MKGTSGKKYHLCSKEACFTPDMPPSRNVNMADRKAPQFNYNAMNPWRYMEIYGAGPHSLTYGRRSLPKENTKALKWEWSQLPINHMFALSSRQRSLDPSIPCIRMPSLCRCKHSHTMRLSGITCRVGTGM